MYPACFYLRFLMISESLMKVCFKLSLSQIGRPHPYWMGKTIKCIFCFSPLGFDTYALYTVFGNTELLCECNEVVSAFWSLWRRSRFVFKVLSLWIVVFICLISFTDIKLFRLLTCVFYLSFQINSKLNFAQRSQFRPYCIHTMRLHQDDLNTDQFEL